MVKKRSAALAPAAGGGQTGPARWPSSATATGGSAAGVGAGGGATGTKVVADAVAAELPGSSQPPPPAAVSTLPKVRIRQGHRGPQQAKVRPVCRREPTGDPRWSRGADEPGCPPQISYAYWAYWEAHRGARDGPPRGVRAGGAAAGQLGSERRAAPSPPTGDSHTARLTRRGSCACPTPHGRGWLFGWRGWLFRRPAGGRATRVGPQAPSAGPLLDWCRRWEVRWRVLAARPRACGGGGTGRTRRCPTYSHGGARAGRERHAA